MIDIKSTTDYKIFKKVWHNRKLNEAHLKNLNASISTKNLLAYTPIIVNEEMEVIDGQHRLEVARRNKLEIYYIIAPDVVTGDVLLLNANEKPWSLPDFIYSWIKQGKKDHQILKKFNDIYGLSFSLLAALLSGQKAHKSTDVIQDLKQGTFLVTHEEQAKMFLDGLASLKPYSQHEAWKGREFILAFQAVLAKVEWKRLIERLEKQKELGIIPIKKNTTVRDAALMLEDIYNYDMRNRVRIY